MSADPQEITVTVQLNTPTVSAGNEVASWATVAVGVSMRMRNHRPAPTSFPSVGEGVMQLTPRFGIFETSRPAFTEQAARYRIIAPDGTVWNCTSVDVYLYTTQVGLQRAI